MRVLAACLLAGLGIAQAHGQTMKPGLWEHRFTMKTQSGEMERAMAEMQKQLAAMPPGQRQQMEQMMAAQGMQMDASGQNVKVCVSPEQARQLDLPKQDARCTQEVTERRGNTVKMRFSCPGNPPTRGEGEITFANDSSYRGQMVVQTAVQGNPEQMTMQQSGRWLGADCGQIRPAR